MVPRMILSVEEGPASTSAPGFCLILTRSITSNTQPIVTPVLSHHCQQFRWSWRWRLFHTQIVLNKWWKTGPGAFPTPSGSSRDHEKSRSGAIPQSWKHLGHVSDICCTVMWYLVFSIKCGQGALHDIALGFLPTRGTARTGDKSLRSHFTARIRNLWVCSSGISQRVLQTRVQ